MALIDTYRNTVLKKREELSKLNSDIAKEQAKKAPLQKKILVATSALQKTTSLSSARAKSNEIERHRKALIDIDKKIGDLQKKNTQKQKELSTAEKNLRNEEAKEHKKQQQAEKKRQNELNKQMTSIAGTLQENSYRQDLLEHEVSKFLTLPKKITVLFMASNPINTKSLRLDEEARNIQEKIRLSEHRDAISFETRWATRSLDILQSINETDPTIVHFSGHGSETGNLVLESSDGNTKLVTKEAITASMSTASDKIRLVVFNACFSSEQAMSIVRNIDAAIGMSDSIGDKAACIFAAQLYSSIGFGYSLKKSFDQAVAALMIENTQEDSIPQLYTKDGINPDEIYFVDSN